MKKHVELDASTPGELTISGRRFRARTFQVGGDIVELYTTTVLAAALGRGTGTIMNWEAAGWLPRPLFRLTGSPAFEWRRYYSRAQIVNLYQAYNRFPFTPSPQSRPTYELVRYFFATVQKVFDLPEVIDVARLPVKATDFPISGPLYGGPDGRTPTRLAQQKGRGIVAQKNGRAIRRGMESPERAQTRPGPERRHPRSLAAHAQSEKPAYRRRPSGSVS